MNGLIDFISLALGVMSFLGAAAISFRMLAIYNDPYPALAAGLTIFGAYSFMVFARLIK